MMKKRVLPAIVSTIDALHNCKRSDYPLLYITGEVLQNNEKEVRKFAVEEAYTFESFGAQNGVFLSKNIDPEKTEIVNYPLFRF